MYKAAEGLLSISLSPPAGRHPIFLCSCQISPLLRVVLFASSVLFIIFVFIFFLLSVLVFFGKDFINFFNCQPSHEAYLWLKISVIKTSLLYEMQLHKKLKLLKLTIIKFYKNTLFFSFIFLEP